MNWLTTVVAVVGLSAPFPDDPKPAAMVRPGDPAPSLTTAKWLQGEPVAKFEPGKVYVVEFWAAWCGARIRHLPHFAEIHSRYQSKGVTVIAVTSPDIRGVAGNTEDDVAAFVKRRGPATGLRFAYADGTATDAWLKGRDHFHTFVVDRTGRIVFAGSPLFLDLVLPKVLAGGPAKAIGEEMDKVDAEYQAVAAAFDRDPDAGLKALGEFEGRYPPLADALPAAAIRLHLLLKQGKPGEGREYAAKLVAKAVKEKNAVMLEMAYPPLREAKADKELLSLAVRAADALVRIDGGKESHSLLRLADAHHASGDAAQARQLARRAVEAAASEPAAVREDIEKEARRLSDGK